MQPYSQQYQEPISNPLTNFDPTLLAGTISGNPLYIIPPTCPTNIIQPDHTDTNASTSSHKRRSIDLEDDSMEAIDEPPSKQLLSERNLFKKFGSLNIDGLINATSTTINEELAVDDDHDDEENNNRSQNITTSDKVAQEEFNRYVYLLFKDIEGTSQNPFKSSNTTLDRLAREERDKLNKAVILWSPPLVTNRFGNNSDDDDDDNNNTEIRQTEEGPTLVDQCDVEFSPG